MSHPRTRCCETPLNPPSRNPLAPGGPYDLPWLTCGLDPVGPHPDPDISYRRPLCREHMDLAWIDILIRCDEAGLIRWPTIPANVVLGAS